MCLSMMNPMPLLFDELNKNKAIPATNALNDCTMGTYGQQMLDVKHIFLSHLERLLKGKSNRVKIYLIS